MTEKDLIIGKLYKGKRQRKNLFSGLTDDRIIVWVNNDSIQYDSYFIKNGRRLPITTKEKFLKWAKEIIE